MFCRFCGKSLPDGSAFCSSCGRALNSAEPQIQPQQPVIHVINTNPNSGYIHKSKWSAFWLCFFLGGLGAHRFYVGKTGTGLIWLFTLGLCGVGSLIDLIVILCDGFRDKAGQPLV